MELGALIVVSLFALLGVIAILDLFAGIGILQSLWDAFIDFWRGIANAIGGGS